MSGVVLRLEGLPFKVTEDEIRDFLTETEAKIEKIHLLLNRDQRPSGIGFIEFESEADLKSAIVNDGKCIGDSKRYVRMGNFNNFIYFFELSYLGKRRFIDCT